MLLKCYKTVFSRINKKMAFQENRIISKLLNCCIKIQKIQAIIYQIRNDHSEWTRLLIFFFK